MADVEIRRPLGLVGLDLGIDPAQGERGMLLADGARYDVAGIIYSRFGRKHVDLEWPKEFGEEGTPDPDYTQTLSNFAAPKATQGIAAFYDQRVQTDAPDILQEPDFEDNTPWGVTGDFAFPTGEEFARYTHSAGSGTLTQTTANFQPDRNGVARTLEVGKTYVLTYTVRTENAGNISAFDLTSSFYGIARTLDKTDGEHSIEFTYGGGGGNFVISVTSIGTATLEIFTLEVRQKEQFVEPPQRLNLVYKSEGKLFLNDVFAGSYGSDWIDGVQFLQGNSRAKILTYGDEVYVADPGNRPLLLRRRPRNEQEYLDRIRYDLRNAGINWPRSNRDTPTATRSGVSSDRPPTGVYRWRVTLENKMGDESNGSLVFAEEFRNDASGSGAVDNNFVVRRPEIPGSLTSGPNAVTHWRIYLSFEPGTVNAFGGVNPDGAEETAFRYVTRIPIATTTYEYTGTDHNVRNRQSLLPFERGAPPKLIDMIIINDTAYGIADVDAIPRERIILEGPGRPLSYTARRRVPTTNEPFGFERPAFDNTEIHDLRVNSQFLFFSPPGEPQYMEQWIRFGKGEEVGVGLSEIGDKPVIFTNLGIYIYDPGDNVSLPTLRRVVSEVGALSRDSIQRTEQGIRFIGSDGVPRLFNGATVDEISSQVLPIFDVDDWSGDYYKFDRSKIGNVVTTNGDRRFYMIYPVSDNPGLIQPGKPTVQSAVNLNMMVGDLTAGRMRWAIDKRSVYDITWLGRESRLLGVDDAGWFWYLEEGFVDVIPNAPDLSPAFDWKVRWYAGRGKRLTRFHAFSIEVDTKGKDITVSCQVDKVPELYHEFTVNHSGRKQFTSHLPGWFKGLYLEIRVRGATDPTAGRVELYDLQVESTSMGGGG